jgi:hypothetical protein
LKEAGKLSLIGRWQLKQQKCLCMPLEHQVSLFCSRCQYKPWSEHVLSVTSRILVWDKTLMLETFMFIHWQ